MRRLEKALAECEQKLAMGRTRAYNQKELAARQAPKAGKQSPRLKDKGREKTFLPRVSRHESISLIQARESKGKRSARKPKKGKEQAGSWCSLTLHGSDIPRSENAVGVLAVVYKRNRDDSGGKAKFTYVGQTEVVKAGAESDDDYVWSPSFSKAVSLPKALKADQSTHDLMLKLYATGGELELSEDKAIGSCGVALGLLLSQKEGVDLDLFKDGEAMGQIHATIQI